jgi:hypothetical protein
MTKQLRKRPPKPKEGDRPTPAAADTADADSDYKIGHGRPPKHSKFKPGKSGNPDGRPKGSRNIATIAKEVLFKQVTITENGRRRKVPAFEALMLNLLKQSLEGDLRAFDKMMKVVPMVQTSVAAEDATENGKAVDPQHDTETLAEFAKMLREADIAEEERNNND